MRVNFAVSFKTIIIMLKLISLLYVLFAAASGMAQMVIVSPEDFKKGDSCGVASYIVYYDMAYVGDTLNHPDKAVHETMCLETGGGISSFYSYEEFLADSANAAVFANGGTSFSGGKNVHWQLYVNYPVAGKTALLEKFGLDRFVCTEDYAAPAWTPVADSSAVIFGYPCRMAVAAYKGRTWYAWYAEDIPLGVGPWKLGGLPGLILQAYDSRRHYVFRATGMAQAAPGRPMYYKGSKYEAVSRKELEDIRRRYHADPDGYLTADSKVTVRNFDKFGNELGASGSEPYNPIELQ